jgi:hypothetical protein
MVRGLPQVVGRRNRRRSRSTATRGPNQQSRRDSVNLRGIGSVCASHTETAEAVGKSMIQMVVDITIQRDEKLSQPTQKPQTTPR